MTNEVEILEEARTAVKNGTPLNKLGAYLKTFKRDIHLKRDYHLTIKKLFVPAALRLPFMRLIHET